LKEEQLKLLAQIVDYSQARANGFVNAIVAHYGMSAQEAKGYLKGCYQHFRSSVTRIKRNHAVIPFGQDADFEEKALDLMAIPDKAAFIKAADELIKLYPLIQNWVKWWMSESVRGIILNCYIQREFGPYEYST
jgi:hypothetical protein